MRTVSRHEEKFIISTATAEMLKSRFRAMLRPDRNAGADGSYFIRSVYFDDAAHTAYHEKLNGVKERSKYRLRYYNFDTGLIFLEKKMKDGNLTGKESAALNLEEAQAFLYGGDTGFAGGNPLTEEFARARRGSMHPVCIVDYDRFAYTYGVEDVRITLDMDVRTRPYSTELFNRYLPTIPVMDEGECVLEVKYNRFLPSHIMWMLEGVPKQRMAVSKYVKCMSVLE